MPPFLAKNKMPREYILQCKMDDQSTHKLFLSPIQSGNHYR